MRVLIVVRPSVAKVHGGDAHLAERAASALRGRGVEVDVAATLTPDAAGYDVAHVYGIFDPDIAEPQVDAIRRAGVPLVVSPVWWDRTPLFRLGPLVTRALAGRRPKAVEAQLARLRRDEPELVRKPGRGAQRHLMRQQALLRRADVAFTGSIIEEYACARVLGVDEMPYFVAPYGLETAAFGETPGVTRSGVVCVGRIEPLKNQAMLLFALRDLDVDVTLVGGSYDADYLKLCRRWATKRTTFADRLPDDELATLLQRTAVHVLPSWGDLPGFVSLEAAARGARVVAGARGSEREYLGPEVEYVDPLDPQAIRAAVSRALDAPPRVRGDALDERLRGLRWDAYAATSVDAYARAIERRSSAQ